MLLPSQNISIGLERTPRHILRGSIRFRSSVEPLQLRRRRSSKYRLISTVGPSILRIETRYRCRQRTRQVTNLVGSQATKTRGPIRLLNMQDTRTALSFQIATSSTMSLLQTSFRRIQRTYYQDNAKSRPFLLHIIKNLNRKQSTFSKVLKRTASFSTR